MALMGHSGSHRVQSMHSSGSIARKLGPSWKQSTGQTSTQSVYLHLMQFSVTTNVMGFLGLPRESGYWRQSGKFKGKNRPCDPRPGGGKAARGALKFQSASAVTTTTSG